MDYRVLLMLMVASTSHLQTAMAINSAYVNCFKTILGNYATVSGVSSADLHLHVGSVMAYFCNNTAIEYRTCLHTSTFYPIDYLVSSYLSTTELLLMCYSKFRKAVATDLTKCLLQPSLQSQNEQCLQDAITRISTGVSNDNNTKTLITCVSAGFPTCAAQGVDVNNIPVLFDLVIPELKSQYSILNSDWAFVKCLLDTKMFTEQDFVKISQTTSDPVANVRNVLNEIYFRFIPRLCDKGFTISGKDTITMLRDCMNNSSLWTNVIEKTILSCLKNNFISKVNADYFCYHVYAYHDSQATCLANYTDEMVVNVQNSGLMSNIQYLISNISNFEESDRCNLCSSIGNFLLRQTVLINGTCSVKFAVEHHYLYKEEIQFCTSTTTVALSTTTPPATTTTPSPNTTLLPPTTTTTTTSTTTTTTTSLPTPTATSTLFPTTTLLLPTATTTTSFPTSATTSTPSIMTTPPVATTTVTTTPLTPSITTTPPTTTTLKPVKIISLTNFSADCPDGLFPYKTHIRHTKDKSTPEIKIPCGLPACDKRYTKMHVNPNGYFPLGSNYENPKPENLTKNSHDMIAAYYYGFDVSQHGMYYKVYTVENDDGTLDWISEVVRAKKKRVKKFNVIWAIVVTWIHARPWNGNGAITFQVIVATDGGKTFMYVKFVDSTLSANSTQNPPVLGVKCSDTPTVRKKFTNTKAKISDKKKLKKLTRAFNIHKYPKGCNGRFVYNRLNKNPPKIKHPQKATKKCWKWYKAENADSARMSRYLKRVQTYCYCSKWMEQVASDSIENPYPHNKKNLQCFFITPPMGVSESVECCYKRNSQAYINYGPDMGSLVSIRTTKQKNKQFKQYRRENKYPRKWCCKKSDNCHLYHKGRPKPAYSCGVLNWFWIFWLFGDPHITTLDGKTYTFNGLGEYIMIRGHRFEIQARTCLAWDKNGKETNATIFCGFAGKNSDNGASFQVLLDVNRQDMKVKINSVDYSSFYKSDPDFAVDFTNISAERNNDTLQISMSGLKLTTSIVAKTLKLDASVNKNLTGTLTGLQGNFDGDSTNDFILPNGTVLPNKNYTEREIFYDFGQKWVTTSATSIFQYETGKSFSDYNDPDFVPLFFEDFPQAKRDEAEAACAGEEEEVSNACIVDYLNTGDQELAKSSGETQSSIKNQTETLQNQQPVVSGPKSVVFTVGQPGQFQLNGTDDGPVTYKIVNSPSSGSFQLNESTGEGFWTANSDSKEEIQLTIVDDKGAEASPWTITIFLCKNCSDNGHCDTSGMESYTESHNVLPCVCNTGWEGDDCNVDIDACALSPCGSSRNCTDLTPEVEQTTGIGYNCTACPDGYFESNSKCLDVDECISTATNTCDQDCFNTIGSFYCDCKSGYRMVDDKCEDIKECEEVHSCQHQCLNSVGSYTCGCFMGYTLNNDGKSCTKESEKCTALGLSCDYACMNNTEGQVVCVCQNGYELAADGKSCSDIDECSRRFCSQNCTNSEGSFTCSCYDGYQLASDKITCTSCDEEHWGPECVNECECDGDGIEGCDPAFGCYCNSGYKGANCSEDRNECEEQPTICGQDKTCVNNDGSYECECLSGYIFDDDNKNCIDIDECFEDEDDADNENENNCTTTESTCENVPGGFSCKCKDGFKQNDTFTCIDIDECTQGSHNCEQLCVNRSPGYYCQCYAGFVLNDTDDISCVKEKDPCEGSTNLTCSYACHVVGTTPTCVCRDGYKLASDQQTCIDVDECSNTTLNLCSQQDSCSNTDGGYTCSCSSGYFLDNDKRTCSECDLFHYGESCSQVCGCHSLGTERCDSVSGCVCKIGWAGTNCSNDLNECYGTDPCTKSNEECVNTIGSYECRCKSGYDNSTGSCKNIDECSDGTSQCEQGCVDSDGGYTCTCRSGFQLNDDNQHCDDIDECAVTSTCDQTCLNTDGGYMCQCNDGYSLNTTDRRSCYVEKECSSGHGCQHNCALVNQANVCSCRSGYSLHTDNKTCNNIDECSTSKPCTDTCTDTNPGFTCSCPAGKYLSADSVTCKECVDGKYGSNCSSNCTCVTDNTDSCNKVNGSCTCETGWKGAKCDTDVDECSESSHNCQDHSTCNNTQGGYDCNCHAGYAPSSALECTGCSGQKYGVNCAYDCTCVIQNTEHCNKTNGLCTCKSGWEGNNCQTDINECQPSNPCTGGKVCTNNDGSYTCKCVSGYRENATGICEDVNECYEGSVCHTYADCTNGEGNYTCACKAGYNGDGHTCTVPGNSGIVGGPEWGNGWDSGADVIRSTSSYTLIFVALLVFALKRQLTTLM